MEENKVYYDINESPFIYEYFPYKFYFTSKFNMERFKNGVENYIKEENLKNQSKYKLDIEFNDMLAMSYYLKIEKRFHKVLCIDSLYGEFYDKDLIKEGVTYGSTFN